MKQRGVAKVNSGSQLLPDPSVADLRVFAGIANAHTLSGAASALGIPLHTVSRALSRLESRAGTALVRRGRDGTALTEKGIGYLTACHKILDACKEAERVLRPETEVLEGTLRITAPIEFARSVLSSLLPKFQAAFPQIKLELSVYCSDWDQELKVTQDIFFKARSPRDSRRHLRVFPPILQGLFASPELIQGTLPKQPEELTSLPCLGYGTAVSDTWVFANAKEQITVCPNVRISVADPDVLTRLTCASAGIAILPLWLAEAHVQAGRLLRLLPDWKLEPVVFCALISGRPRPQSKEYTFVEYLKRTLGTMNDPRCDGKDPERFFSL